MEILRNKLVFGALWLIAFAACRKEATIKLPPAEKKLVVTCFLEPGDTLITVVVRTSAPKFDTAAMSSRTVGPGSIYDDEVKDATVLFYQGEQPIKLAFDPNYQLYHTVIKAPIQEGATYRLEVSTPEGKKVDAVTTVPAGKFDISDFIVRKTSFTDSTFLQYNVSFQFNDLPGATYVTALTADIVNSEPFAPIGYMPGSYYEFKTDADQPKTSYSFYYENGAFTSEKIRYLELQLNVLNCSREFYLYNESAYRASYSGNNPFAEPALVFSNINGGFGCFGACTRVTLKKRVI